MTQNVGNDRRKRGNVMVFAALSMVALLMFGALAIDMGLVWAARTQSQSVVDGAALAAAGTMITPGGNLDLAGGRTAAQTLAAANSTVANPSATVQPTDVTFGNWDVVNRVFLTEDDGVDLSDKNQVTAARVNLRMDGVDNTRSPAFLAGVGGQGITGFEVNNTAIAYLGFEGEWDPGEFDLPIAIDSCDLSSDNGCGHDFCALSQTPVNPCALDNPQEGDGLVTCLEFDSTPEQNACWTEFSNSEKNVDVPGLKRVADDGNSQGLEAGDKAYLNNGDKAEVQKYLADMMYGGEKPRDPYYNDPQGEDRYPEEAGDPPAIDSWVVKLPVFECQDGTHCSNRQSYKITGGVCFEIREITGTPTRVIRGRFLCPDDPDEDVQDLYEEYCGDLPGDRDAPGGCNFGDRAEKLVLVE